MKTGKLMRYQLDSTKLSVLMFYGIYALVMLFVNVASLRLRGGSSSGTDLASMIFLFVAGLNFFREPFYLSQALGVSRRSFFWGSVGALYLVSLVMTLIDLGINRLLNLFMPNMPFHDMVYQAGEAFDRSQWVATSDMGAILRGFLWSFALASLACLFGFFLRLVYYRSNKIMKIVVSVGIAACVNIVPNLVFAFRPDRSVIDALLRFFSNDLNCALIFLLLGAVFAGGSWLLMRRAPVKR